MFFCTRFNYFLTLEIQTTGEAIGAPIGSQESKLKGVSPLQQANILASTCCSGGTVVSSYSLFVSIVFARKMLFLLLWRRFGSLDT